MRRALLFVAVVAVCALPGSALASPPPQVHAAAYLVQDARTGEVLASYRAHAHLPIASITKLMTVLVALEHHKLTDVVVADPRAAIVGESTIYLRPHERMTVHDLVEGALVQSANDAAAALALSVSRDFASFAQLMNAKARAYGLRDTHFVRPDGLDVPDAYSSAADVTRLGRIAMRNRFIRDTVDQETAYISGGRTLHTWDDLLSLFPETFGVKTGHTAQSGWCQVAAARGRGATIYATLLGGPSRDVRNADLESLLVWGLAQFRIVPFVQVGRSYATVRLPYGRAPLDLVAASPVDGATRVGHPLIETVVAPIVVSLPVHEGDVLGHVEVWSGDRVVATRDLVASRTVNKPSAASRLGWYAGRTFHHLAHFF